MEKYLTDFDYRILEFLGVRELDGEYNPVTRALSDNPDFVENAGINRREKTALARLAVLCQINVFNHNGGPEGDGKTKALRRHWYSYFKTEVAQPFARQLGEDLQDNAWGRNWSGRLSSIYATLVSDTDLNYADLWVNDGSRMMDTDNECIAAGYNLIVAVEKDSLFEDFKGAAKRLGARVLYSGRGKSSLAAVEKLLRAGFRERWLTGFTEENPLYVIHVSDYDYDGEAIIGPTFADQCRVFTDNVKDARVGIEPEHVLDAGYKLNDKWYEVSLSNSAAREWAKEKAIEGRYGFEVEAVRVSYFHSVLVDAFLRLVDFNCLVEQLREDCKPDIDGAVGYAQNSILRSNKEYQRMKSALEKYERHVRASLFKIAGQCAKDVPLQTGHPSADEYRDHVTGKTSYPWRPFSQLEQTVVLEDILLEEKRDELSQWDFAGGADYG